MKTRITTLNSRSNARFPWPQKQVLYHPETRGQCCIGQQGRQNAGVPLDVMEHIVLPMSNPGFNHPPEWYALWKTTVPEDVGEKILKVAGLKKVLGPEAKDFAVALNDLVAIAYNRPTDAVAGLRILWRWLGETQDERWVIRWLRDDEEE